MTHVSNAVFIAEGRIFTFIIDLTFIYIYSVTCCDFRIILVRCMNRLIMVTFSPINVCMLNKLGNARHIIGHFGDKSFQEITSTGTGDSKQTSENKLTPRKQTGPIGKRNNTL